jgi:hypothetical protein
MGPPAAMSDTTLPNPQRVARIVTAYTSQRMFCGMLEEQKLQMMALQLSKAHGGRLRDTGSIEQEIQDTCTLKLRKS